MQPAVSEISKAKHWLLFIKGILKPRLLRNGFGTLSEEIFCYGSRNFWYQPRIILSVTHFQLTSLSDNSFRLLWTIGPEIEWQWIYAFFLSLLEPYLVLEAASPIGFGTFRKQWQFLLNLVRRWFRKFPKENHSVANRFETTNLFEGG